MSDEYFGSPGQTAMQQKGEILIRLMAGDPRLCSHGRGVQLAQWFDGADALVADIARLIGASGCEAVPRDQTQALCAALEVRGLALDVISEYSGARDGLDAARATLAARPLPDDLTVRVIGTDTPGEWLAAFSAVALPHGVLPPAGPVMRGITRPGFGIVAFDRAGKPVGCAGSVLLQTHPNHPLAKVAQWGQLATDPARQGQGIARALGAMALIRAYEVLGATGVRTGIRPGNAPSARLCEGLGVTDSGLDIVLAMHTESFGEDRLTK